MFELCVYEKRIDILRAGSLIGGSVKTTPVKITFDTAWNGLVKVAVFESGGDVKTVDLTAETVEIPWELLTNKHVGKKLSVGVYGTDGNTLVMPTVYRCLGVIKRGTDTADDPEADPTKSAYAQYRAIADTAAETANTAKATADGSIKYIEKINARLGEAYTLIEQIVIGYGVTSDTVFQSGTAYYKNTGTPVIPVYTAMAAGTDYTAGNSVSSFGQPVYVYSNAGIASIERAAAPDGTPYNFSRVCVTAALQPPTADSGASVSAYFDDSTYLFANGGVTQQVGGVRYNYWDIKPETGYWEHYWARSDGSAYYSLSAYSIITSPYYKLRFPTTQYPAIKKILLAKTNAPVIAAGGVISIYGVKAL